jgi:hypothetical protein
MRTIADYNTSASDQHNQHPKSPYPQSRSASPGVMRLPPLHQSPNRVLKNFPVGFSPNQRSPFQPVVGVPVYVTRSPDGIIRHSPARLVYVQSPGGLQRSPVPSISPYRNGPVRVSPLRLPPGSSGRKRERSESIDSSSDSSGASSEYEYSSSSPGSSEEDDRVPQAKLRRIEGTPDRIQLSKPPSPVKYYPGGVDDEEDLGSEDSDFEDESIDTRLDDLRDFIDFDPRFNKKVITRKETYTRSDDPLREFLFNHDAKSRKWFRTFAWSAVGSKLAKKKCVVN